MSEKPTVYRIGNLLIPNIPRPAWGTYTPPEPYHVGPVKSSNDGNTEKPAKSELVASKLQGPVLPRTP